MNKSPPSLTPSQLNRQVRTLLESHYDYVWVEGEISNFAQPSSGHWYFTLKDDSAQVRCAMFRNRNQRVRMQPENGDAVRLRARVSLYEGRGEFQLIGEFMEAAGAGALQARFEALRDRLQAEGLFDQSRKKALPNTVNHLAIVSSPTAAALQDILKVLNRRDPAIEVTVLPTAVQGEAAPEQLRRALERANALAAQGTYAFDAIILARGGGSLEDLWAFNDEQLARAIAASELTVVSGVGHEVDVTIADFAADCRAPTPSAAAELLSADGESRQQALLSLQRRLAQAIARQLERGQHRVEQLAARLQHPGARLREQVQLIDGLDTRLRSAMRQRLQAETLQLQIQLQGLQSRSPLRNLQRFRGELARTQERLAGAMDRCLRFQARELKQRNQLFETLSPLAVLQRGYAIISDQNGRIIRQAGDTQVGNRLSARLAEGSLALEVVDDSAAQD